MSDRVRYTQAPTETLVQLVESKLVIGVVLVAVACFGWYAYTEITPMFLRLSAALDSLQAF